MVHHHEEIRATINNYTSHRSAEIGQLQLTVGFLWLFTPVVATFSVALVLVAMTTNHWLLTKENMSNPMYNGTGDSEFLPKDTVSGLWTLCHTNPGETSMICSNIDYFPLEEYSPDPNDSTLAIPYTVTKSGGFFVLGGALLVVAEALCMRGQCGGSVGPKHRSIRGIRFYTFAAGVVFIVAGLIMLAGLVMYISVLKAEIGGKLRPRSQLQPPLFTFRYGFSFVLYVAGFVVAEIAGISALFLYIYSHQLHWLVGGEQMDSEGGCNSAVVDVAEIHKMVGIGVVPMCRRHPHPDYISSRRFYLDSSSSPPNNSDSSSAPQQRCEKHPHHFPPPPPEAYHYSSDCMMPRDATTNTVSTMADIELLDHDDDDGYGNNHEHEFVPFDLEVPPPPLHVKQLVPSCSNDLLRRTTPV